MGQIEEVVGNRGKYYLFPKEKIKELVLWFNDFPEGKVSQTDYPEIYYCWDTQVTNNPKFSNCDYIIALSSVSYDNSYGGASLETVTLSDKYITGSFMYNKELIYKDSNFETEKGIAFNQTGEMEFLSYKEAVEKNYQHWHGKKSIVTWKDSNKTSTTPSATYVGYCQFKSLYGLDNDGNLFFFSGIDNYSQYMNYIVENNFKDKNVDYFMTGNISNDCNNSNLIWEKQEDGSWEKLSNNNVLYTLSPILLGIRLKKEGEKDQEPQKTHRVLFKKK